MVVLHGTYKLGDGVHALFDRKCFNTRPTLLIDAGKDAHDSEALAQLRRLTLSHPHREIDVIFEGRFVQAKAFECFGGGDMCFYFKLEGAALKKVLTPGPVD